MFDDEYETRWKQINSYYAPGVKVTPRCCLNMLPSREGEPLVGYWVGKPYWNQGICAEALRLMIGNIRQTTEIQSLISSHFIDNPASGRVMEKCGFVPNYGNVYSSSMAEYLYRK